MRGSKAGLADVARLFKAAQAEHAKNKKSHSEQAHPPDLNSIPATEEAAAFRRVVQTVTRLQSPARVEHDPQPAQAKLDPVLRRAAAAGKETGRRADAGISDNGEINALFSADGTTFRRNDMAPDTTRQLRRGHWRAGAELDLHGLRREAARQAVVAFIRNCLDRGIRCVRIIHGKGYGSPDFQPVLKKKVRAWLIQMQEVQAFAEAPEDAGGSGALLALLEQTQKGDR
jgi:DNA-nicking Smr family endonuclease